MSREKKILIVDDAAFMRAMLRRAIEGTGGEYRILEAQDGEKALEMYSEHSPGLVLLDISMPGINGIEVLKRLKNLDKDAFVIMCSAIGQDNMIVEAVENGAAEFIVKPFKAEQIAEALQLAFPPSGREGSEG